MFFLKSKNRSSFTLIELLVTLAIVAVLSVVVVMTLNPAELLKQARDSNRLSDLATINTALNLFSTDVTSGFMGTSTIVYTSLVNTINQSTTTCAGMGLPALPTGWTYNCPTSTQSLRNTDGTGWIPVNFQRISSNSPISQLPIDPQNTTSTKYYTYVTGGSWKVIATPESQKYLATAGTDGGSNIGQFEVGNNMNLAPFTDGLVGWWKLDEGSTATTTDSSGWERNGTVSSTVSYWTSGSQCHFNNCVYFDGASTNIDVHWTAGTIPTGGSVTYSFWAKTSSYPAQWSALISIERHRLVIVPGGAIDFYGNSNGGYSIRGYPNATSTWTNIAVTQTGTITYMYQNGQLIAQNDSGIPLLQNGFSSIGKYAYGYSACGANCYNGYLNDMRVYSRALSATEVLAIYNATK